MDALSSLEFMKGEGARSLPPSERDKAMERADYFSEMAYHVAEMELQDSVRADNVGYLLSMVFDVTSQYEELHPYERMDLAIEEINERANFLPSNLHAVNSAIDDVIESAGGRTRLAHMFITAETMLQNQDYVVKGPQNIYLN